MTYSVAYSFDTEDRKVFIIMFSENENGDTTTISEDILSRPIWAEMDDDTWLREIPAINAELEANFFIANLQVSVA